MPPLLKQAVEIAIVLAVSIVTLAADVPNSESAGFSVCLRLASAEGRKCWIKTDGSVQFHVRMKITRRWHDDLFSADLIHDLPMPPEAASSIRSAARDT